MDNGSLARLALKLALADPVSRNWKGTGSGTLSEVQVPLPAELSQFDSGDRFANHRHNQTREQCLGGDWGNMPSPVQIAGDIAAAAAALAGLLLVFLGSVSTSYGSYQKQEQNAVRSKYQRMAWLGFIGFCLAVLSAFLSIAGKWFSIDCLVAAAAVLLAVGFALVVMAAFFAVLEIR